MHLGSTFHPRPYPEPTALLFTITCSAFTSENFKSFARRLVKVHRKQYGGKRNNKEMSGCSLSSLSTSAVIKRLAAAFKTFNKLCAFCLLFLSHSKLNLNSSVTVILPYTYLDFRQSDFDLASLFMDYDIEFNLS